MKTKIWYIVIILSIVAIIRWIIVLYKKSNSQSNLNADTLKSGFSPIIYPTTIREDIRGSGAYAATRIGHLHEGIDLLCNEGQNVYAPFDGTITRVAYPYVGDTRWKGLVLEDGNGLMLKIFYVSSIKTGEKVLSGEVIATAQAISKKYGIGMEDHIHVEVLRDNIHIDPTNLFLV